MNLEEKLIIDLLKKEKIALNFMDLEFKIRMNANLIPIDKIINIFKIRYRIAVDKDIPLQEKISKLLLRLESNSSEINSLRILSVKDKRRFYIVYLNRELDKIAGFIDGDI